MNKFMALMIAAAAGCAQAGLTFVDNRADLGGTDQIHWEQYGADFTVVPSNSIGTTDLGAGFRVAQPNGANMEKRTNPFGGWAGNFGDGQAVLWTQGVGGTISIYLDSPVRGIGAQMQNDSYGAFTGRIEAFDNGGNSLGFFDRDGDSNGNNDDSAIFLGVRSDTPIARIDFSVPGSFSMAINYLDLDRVPSPGSAALLGCGGLLACRRRR